MIKVEHLKKQYGGHVAVSDLSFSVEDGRIYGLLGPNGAGKSTTMNIMTGCLAPTSGTVSIDGFDIFDDAKKAKARIGYLPEQPPLYLDMTPLEYLRFVAKVKGVPKAERKGQIERVVSLTQIGEMQNRLIKNLSKGYRQRVGIAQALLSNPEVIILDEPTVGLDPKQIIEIRDLIRSLAKEHTVILSSHILGEVQAVCDHILIIHQGVLVASDTPENLEKLFAGVLTLQLSVKGEQGAVESVLSALESVEYSIENAGEGRLSVKISASADTSEDALREAVFLAFSGASLPILDMTAAKASLEDIFLEFTSDGGADAGKESTASDDGGKEKEA